MNSSERGIYDQVSLVGAYHFLMGLAYLIGAAAIYVYAILPILGEAATDLPQKLFMPVTGGILSLLLVGLYANTGMGLKRMSNSARMTAVFLALVGIVAGLFGVSAAVALSIISLAPSSPPIFAIGIGSVATYVLIAGVDLIILVFLAKEPVREVFYAYSPEPQAEALLPKAKEARKAVGDKRSKAQADVPLK